MSTAVAAVPAAGRRRVRGIRRCRLWSGLLGLDRWGARARRASAQHDRALDRTSLGSQSRLVDLYLRDLVDVISGGVRVDHPDVVRAADHCRAWHCLARCQLRVCKGVVTVGTRRIFGAAFAASSVLVPYCMGAIAGGIASGRVPAGGKAGDPVHSWINLTSVVGGVLAVAAVAYLAAVYLVWDARRLDDGVMVEYFRRRAIVAAVLIGIIGFIGIFVLRADTPYLFSGLTSRALPLVILGVLCGIGALVLLVRNAHRGARVLAIVAVASVIVSWGVAQWPYVLPESLTFAAAAAPTGSLTAVLVVVGLAAVIVVPGFVLLFLLHQRGLLPDEGVEDQPAVARTTG